MLSNQQQQPHLYSHQHHQYQHDPPWLQQQATAHHHQQPPQQTQHLSHLPQHQQHAQAQAAAALNAAAQRSHFNSGPANNVASNGGSGYSQGHGSHSLSADLGGASSLDGNFTEEHKRLVTWVAELLSGNSREQALMELSKKREQVPELAMIIWHSFGESSRNVGPVSALEDSFVTAVHMPGVMTALVQEIISVYPLLNPSQLTAAASNRVCNALALLQCVASHNDTRGHFLNGKLRLLALI